MVCAPVTFETLLAPQTENDPLFLKYLRQEAGLDKISGNEDGQYLEAKARFFIERSQKDIEACIAKRSSAFRIPSDPSHTYLLHKPKVDNEICQQEISDYFKVRATEYLQLANFLEQNIRASLQNRTNYESERGRIIEMNNISEKAEEYLRIGEALSLDKDNRARMNMA